MTDQIWYRNTCGGMFRDPYFLGKYGPTTTNAVVSDMRERKNRYCTAIVEQVG